MMYAVLLASLISLAAGSSGAGSGAGAGPGFGASFGGGGGRGGGAPNSNGYVPRPMPPMDADGDRYWWQKMKPFSNPKAFASGQQNHFSGGSSQTFSSGQQSHFNGGGGSRVCGPGQDCVAVSRCQNGQYNPAYEQPSIDLRTKFPRSSRRFKSTVLLGNNPARICRHRDVPQINNKQSVLLRTDQLALLTNRTQTVPTSKPTAFYLLSFPTSNHIPPLKYQALDNSTLFANPPTNASLLACVIVGTTFYKVLIRRAAPFKQRARLGVSLVKVELSGSLDLVEGLLDLVVGSFLDQLPNNLDQLLNNLDQLLNSPDQHPSNLDRLLRVLLLSHNSRRFRLQSKRMVHHRLPNNLDQLLNSPDQLPSSLDQLLNSLDQLPNNLDQLLNSPDQLPSSLDQLLNSLDQLPNSLDQSHNNLDRLLLLSLSSNHFQLQSKLMVHHRLPNNLDLLPSNLDQFPNSLDQHPNSLDQHPNSPDQFPSNPDQSLSNPDQSLSNPDQFHLLPNKSHFQLQIKHMVHQNVPKIPYRRLRTLYRILRNQTPSLNNFKTLPVFGTGNQDTVSCTPPKLDCVSVQRCHNGLYNPEYKGDPTIDMTVKDSRACGPIGLFTCCEADPWPADSILTNQVQQDFNIPQQPAQQPNQQPYIPSGQAGQTFTSHQNQPSFPSQPNRPTFQQQPNQQPYIPTGQAGQTSHQNQPSFPSQPNRPTFQSQQQPNQQPYIPTGQAGQTFTNQQNQQSFNQGRPFSQNQPTVLGPNGQPLPPLRPLPPPQPYTGPLAEDTPVEQCAAALICVYQNQCNSTGYIKGEPQPEDDLVTYRVQLTPCINNAEGGFIGVCCRDPDYTDPWPQCLELQPGTQKYIMMGCAGKRRKRSAQGEEQPSKLDDLISGVLQGEEPELPKPKSAAEGGFPEVVEERRSYVPPSNYYEGECGIEYDCVPWYLCLNGWINREGTGILDLRKQEANGTDADAAPQVSERHGGGYFGGFSTIPDKKCTQSTGENGVCCHKPVATSCPSEMRCHDGWHCPRHDGSQFADIRLHPRRDGLLFPSWSNKEDDASNFGHYTFKEEAL
ncbi:unnamed protein product [Cyprideis torosa]|uniref:Uncharacterized protein n=1 Tax=Cyprideis torosa TaxID=163714 RepID=A0A7R8W636_9CRUS|nr:unnamed protein product [Cyprideis torosa]CAG0886064.1 unnamed protein product [Cyprideis torosa]